MVSSPIVLFASDVQCWESRRRVDIKEDGAAVVNPDCCFSCFDCAGESPKWITCAATLTLRSNACEAASSADDTTCAAVVVAAAPLPLSLPLSDRANTGEAEKDEEAKEPSAGQSSSRSSSASLQRWTESTLFGSETKKIAQ